MINSINSAQELQFLLANQPPSQYPTSPPHPTTLRSIPIHLSPHDRVYPDEPPISELLYSGFVEHLGRCVYGGIVDDYRKPSPAGLLEKQDVKGDEVDKGRLGWRRDVKALMGKGELEVPMIRWPGGMSSTLLLIGPNVYAMRGKLMERQLCVQLPLARRRRAHQRPAKADRAGLAVIRTKLVWDE